MQARVAVPLLLTMVAFPVGLTIGVRLSSNEDGRTVRPAFAVESGSPTALNSSGDHLSQDSPRFTPVVAAAARISPSVVSITVLATRSVSRRSRFDEFFGMVPRQLERQIQGMGSGFAIDADGTIITNEHVVSGADSIVVTDVNGRLYRAEVIGTDPITDIAVLRVEAGAIPPAPIGGQKWTVMDNSVARL